MTTKMQTVTTLFQARKIIHAPEAFSYKIVQEAIAFVEHSSEADDEDRFWADTADHPRE